jgi:hypothetical protein
MNTACTHIQVITDNNNTWPIDCYIYPPPKMAGDVGRRGSVRGRGGFRGRGSVRGRLRGRGRAGSINNLDASLSEGDLTNDGGGGGPHIKDPVGHVTEGPLEDSQVNFFFVTCDFFLSQVVL